MGESACAGSCVEDSEQSQTMSESSQLPPRCLRRELMTSTLWGSSTPSGPHQGVSCREHWRSAALKAGVDNMEEVQVVLSSLRSASCSEASPCLWRGSSLQGVFPRITRFLFLLLWGLRASRGRLAIGVGPMSRSSSCLLVGAQHVVVRDINRGRRTAARGRRALASLRVVRFGASRSHGLVCVTFDCPAALVSLRSLCRKRPLQGRRHHARRAWLELREALGRFRQNMARASPHTRCPCPTGSCVRVCFDGRSPRCSV